MGFFSQSPAPAPAEVSEGSETGDKLGPNAQILPLTHPTPDSKPDPLPALTEDQQTKYNSLLETAKGFTDVTCENDTTKSGPLTDRELCWLSRENLCRYLRATRWDVTESSKRLLATLAWRREYGLDNFTPEYISPEQETGKQIIMGYDRAGRPCQYLNPSRQNTEPSPKHMHHLFYMVERVTDVMPPGVETLSLMIDFKPTKQRANTSVPISTAREVLHVLQNHYPERLGRALIINVPWVVWGFFKLITPFIDPITREKLKFNEDMTQYVPASQLWSHNWGGEMDIDYNHAEYWPALNELCQKRREEKMRRWAVGGREVGESEVYLTGGTDVSTKGVQYSSAARVEENSAARTVDGEQHIEA